MADSIHTSRASVAPEGSDDLFSFLLTLLENSRTLICFSLGAGLIALTLAFWIPARYVSAAMIDPVAGLPLDIDHQAFLALREERQKLLPLILRSPDTLSQSRERLNLGSDVGSSQVKVHTDGTISIQIQAPTPETAKALADALITVALEKTQPSETEIVRLETELKSLVEQIHALRRAGESLRTRLSRTDPANDLSGQLASNLGSVIRETSTLERRIAFTQLIISGADTQVVLEPPEIPIKPAGLGHLAWLAVGAIVGLMMGLTWILLSQSFSTWRSSPGPTARIEAISTKLPFTRKH